MERQETRLLGFITASVSESNFHLERRRARQHGCSVFLCFNPLVDYHPHNIVPSFCCLFKIENILALFMPTVINSSF